MTMSYLILVCVYVVCCCVTTHVVSSTPTLSCPTDWTPFGGACYRFFEESKTWEDAEATCQSNFGGHLVSINSKKENKFVLKLSQSLTHSSWSILWLGVRKPTGMTTPIWSDNSTPDFFTNWILTPPFKNVSCGYMITKRPSKDSGELGKWWIHYCGFACRFMCKFIPDPTEFYPNFESNNEIDIPVYRVRLHNINSTVVSGVVDHYEGDLRINVNKNGMAVAGYDLWKVGVWASDHADGSGKKIGYSEQVLTGDQASTPFPGGLTLLIPDIAFQLNISEATCVDRKYICTSFNKGDSPVQRRKNITSNLRLNVFGVKGRISLNAKPHKLIGCQRFRGATCTSETTQTTADLSTTTSMTTTVAKTTTRMTTTVAKTTTVPVSTTQDGWSAYKDLELHCEYNGISFLPGDNVTIDKCTSCVCTHSLESSCYTQSCPESNLDREYSSSEVLWRYTCWDSITFPDECCHICPMNVPVYGVEFSQIVSNAVSGLGAVINITVDLTVLVIGRAWFLDVEGRNLWKVGMWVSASSDGLETEVGFVSQVLSETQASKRMHNENLQFGAPVFTFSLYDINYKLDTSNISCEDIHYLCASFSAGDSPETPTPSYLSGRHKVPLHVYGTYEVPLLAIPPWASPGISSSVPPTVEPYDPQVGCTPFNPCSSS